MMPFVSRTGEPLLRQFPTLRRPPRPRHRLAELELRAFLEDALPLCIGPIPCPATYWVLGKFPSIFCRVTAFTWVSSGRTQEVERALDAAEIHARRRGLTQARTREQGGHCGCLTGSEFDH